MTPDSSSTRVAVVTGAGSGIGRATAEAFAAAGAAVACLDIDGFAANAVADTLPGPAVGLACDVSTAADVAAAVEAVLTELGRIDVLVNVAGIGSAMRIEDTSLEEWNRILDVNLTGTFLMCRAVLPHLAEGGAIVNVASVAGLTGVALAAAYAASKGGVVAFSRALALELSDRGVTVRCVCPAGVDTPMVARFRLPPAAEVPALARRPRTALLPPAEVAAAIVAAADACDGEVVIVVSPGAPGG